MSGSTASGKTVAVLRCTRCDRPMDSPVFCAACVCLYPADGMDYFEIFGLPRAFDLDAAALRSAYLGLARSVHPDKIAAASPEAARMSMRLSAQLNEAFETLRDPIRRADYLLERCGGDTAVQDKTVPQDVLSETLMLREEIEEARAAGDESALAALKARVRERYDAGSARVAELARGLPGDEPLRSALRQALNAHRYYQRMLEQFD